MTGKCYVFPLHLSDIAMKTRAALVYIDMDAARATILRIKQSRSC